jgi:hypothetical protein
MLYHGKSYVRAYWVLLWFIGGWLAGALTVVSFFKG